MRKPIRPLWIVILTDVLIALLILGGWVLARGITIRRMADAYRQDQQSVTVSAAPAAAAPATTAAPTEETAPSDPTAEETPLPEDDRTPWQIRFAEHFTPEVETGDGYYTSPNVSIHVTEHTYEGLDGTTVYYVADIYIAHIDCFRSFFAKGRDFPSTTDSMEHMGRESGAVIAVNGDYCGLSYGGTVLRNGEPVYSAITGSDVCLLYRDGRMECPALTSFDVADYQGDDALWQVWTFGPALLDGNGRALSLTEMNRCSTSRPENPRTALGYYEPGHYCFIVADGRDANYSAGLWLDEFAEVCALTGCAQAYNMDGGGSSMMVMDGEFVNRPSSGGRRGIPDIILIREPADKEAGE